MGQRPAAAARAGDQPLRDAAGAKELLRHGCEHEERNEEADTAVGDERTAEHRRAELERIAGQPKEIATVEMQRIYSEPVKEELIAQRVREAAQWHEENGG